MKMDTIRVLALIGPQGILDTNHTRTKHESVTEI